MLGKKGAQPMNLLEVTNEQLLERLIELDAEERPMPRNSPVIDGSMEAFFELLNDGLTIIENSRKEAK